MCIRDSGEGGEHEHARQDIPEIEDGEDQSPKNDGAEDAPNHWGMTASGVGVRICSPAVSYTHLDVYKRQELGP